MRRGLVAAATVCGFLLVASPAAAFQLDGGCSGNGSSFDPDGQLVSSGSAPSSSIGTKAKPFEVHPSGTVEWDGQGPAMTGHTWQVQVFGVPVRSGGSANDPPETDADGTEKVGGYLPFKVTGMVYVSGDISGEGGSCSGSGWFKLVGSPVGTLPWLVGIAATAAGATVFVFARPTAPPTPGPGFTEGAMQ